MENETEIEDIAIQLAEKDKSSLWSHFMPRHLKLHLIKSIINYTSPRILRLAEPREPTYPVTQIVDKVFAHLEDVVQHEMKRGAYGGDRNMLNLVRATRRALVTVAEEDVYYRTVLHHLLLCLGLEVQANMSRLAIVEEVERNE